MTNQCQMSNVKCQMSWHINVKFHGISTSNVFIKPNQHADTGNTLFFFNVTLSIKGISEEMFYKVYTTYYELGCKVPLNVFSRDRGDKWLVALYLTLPRVAKCQFFYTEQNS